MRAISNAALRNGLACSLVLWVLIAAVVLALT